MNWPKEAPYGQSCRFLFLPSVIFLLPSIERMKRRSEIRRRSGGWRRNFPFSSRLSKLKRRLRFACRRLAKDSNGPNRTSRPPSPRRWRRASASHDACTHTHRHERARARRELQSVASARARRQQLRRAQSEEDQRENFWPAAERGHLPGGHGRCQEGGGGGGEAGGPPQLVAISPPSRRERERSVPLSEKFRRAAIDLARVHLRRKSSGIS